MAASAAVLVPGAISTVLSQARSKSSPEEQGRHARGAVKEAAGPQGGHCGQMPDGGMQSLSSPPSTGSMFEEQLDSFSSVRFRLHSDLSRQVRKQ